MSLRPDVVTLDIEMPNLDGLGALTRIRDKHARLPVIMFSTLTERGATATLDALSRGASDYVTKPSNTGQIADGIAAVRDQAGAADPRPGGPAQADAWRGWAGRAPRASGLGTAGRAGERAAHRLLDGRAGRAGPAAAAPARRPRRAGARGAAHAAGVHRDARPASRQGLPGSPSARPPTETRCARARC
ncbi:response regulator [Nocardioides convexus]|uniref:response regulator n=1 Tax=Nocardioides convexus TaxID=2712224 RepID=UPI0024185F74|nr:response regulator [Nocardioides convexus]